jgi:hypothetical protein
MANWMKDAVNPAHKGDFTRKAKAAGMGTQAFASKVLGADSGASTQTKRQANLARTFSRFHRR